MATFLLGVTRMGKVRKEYVRGTAQVERSGEREARLRLFGHVHRSGYFGQTIMKMKNQAGGKQEDVCM